MWRFFCYVTTTLSLLLLQQQILNCLKVALFFGTFKLHIEVRLWLRYFLSCHCEMLCIMWQLHFSRSLKNIFLITLEIRYLPGRFNYVQKYDTVSLCVGSSFWYVCITYWNYFRLPLPLRHNYVIYLFKVLSFFDDVIITLNYGNCWNVWIVYGSYVIKWSY